VADKVNPLDKLLDVALHPEKYGDSVQLTMLEYGGMTICPLSDEGPGLDEARRIVLDADQTEMFRAYLHMDAQEASDKVSNKLMKQYADAQIRKQAAKKGMAPLVNFLFALAVAIIVGILFF